ncbi:L,D-peptidoglycan transpeptidase YkuD (ErfK/YbiS/YcfS/YnhG family) [Methylacidiphilum kamchatkense Kam1]|uniref:L,D-peptidoglycan transpeptidase YkuD (ErfK/YbiS/YcfS/YnhG family) n=2 Tax=Methylacidiphilum kamchatkense TaxID=431057 RepID=A0A516TPH8_9BACT|nr:L,D-peptidoglycan transpeptidase YkuD (ErfK/YbiS/YcfS/YnhG family) [Methylacidiphilum kamchatkense Kam1]
MDARPNKTLFIVLFIGLLVVLFSLFLLYFIDKIERMFPKKFPKQQKITVVVPTPTSCEGYMRFFERIGDGGQWTSESDFIPVLIGRNGLSWGRGLHDIQEGEQKKEGDGKTPAGIFNLGLIMGVAKELPLGASWPLYHKKSPLDAWIEDPTLPHYNHLVTISEASSPPTWFEKQRLRIEDPHLEWMVFIEHNYPDAIPGMGSAVFLHERYGEHTPTSGCVAMEKERLIELIRWISYDAKPKIVILSIPDYARLQIQWDLPPLHQAYPEAFLIVNQNKQ